MTTTKAVGWQTQDYYGNKRWYAWYRGSRTDTYVWQPDITNSYWANKYPDGRVPYRVYVKGDFVGETPSLTAAKKLAERKGKYKADPECRAPDWDDMRQPSKNELCTPKGHVRIKPIGKGAFSRVGRAVRKDHRPGTRVLALTAESGTDKDVMQMAYDYADVAGKMGLPKVRKLGHTRQGETVYEMPLYRKVTTATPRAFRDMKALQRAWKKGMAQADWTDTGYQRNQRVLTFARAEKNAGKLTNATFTALEQVVNTAANWGAQMTLELPKRNLAVSARGDRLKLLDPVFDQDELIRKRNQRAAAARKAAFGAQKGWW